MVILRGLSMSIKEQNHQYGDADLIDCKK